MDYKGTPTIRPATKFDIEKDTAALRKAMKGLGTDEQAIINILTSLSSEQREKLLEHYNTTLERDLIKDLKSELSGRFEDVILGLMMHPIEYVCKRIHDALKYVSLNKAENVLIETLYPRNDEDIAKIVVCYEDMYDCSLAENIRTLTHTNDFRLMLTALLTLSRDKEGTVHEEKAKEQAEQLIALGKGALHPSQDFFYLMLVKFSFAQLRLIFAKYKELSGHSINEAIKRGISQFQDIMLCVVECVQSPPAFFATRLFKAMDGAGTDDTTLIRIIVSRSEIDLGNIKEEFERLYNRTLVSAVKSETSGDYKRALCALIGGA